MKTFILKPRYMGKTTDIIKEVKAHDGILVVFSEREAMRIIRSDPSMRHKVFSWDDIKHKLAGRHNPVFIDNADYLLQEIVSPLELKGISMTIGE